MGSLKVKLTATQFATSLNPVASAPLSGSALSGELPGQYDIRVELSASDAGALLSAVSAAGGSVGASLSPPFCVVDTSGNVTKLLVTRPQATATPTAQTLLVISGSYALSTLQALFPSQVFVQADDILDD
jgi:hypothetical protein